MAGWNLLSKFYKLRILNPITYPLHYFETRAAHKLISKIPETQLQGKALDIGSGIGDSLNVIPRRFDPIFALDRSAGMLQKLQSNYSEVEPALADALDLPFEVNSFDLVICIGLAEYIPSPEELIAEISRVLRPGAYALMTFSPAGIFNSIRKLLGPKLYYHESQHLYVAGAKYELSVVAGTRTLIQNQLLFRKHQDG